MEKNKHEEIFRLETTMPMAGRTEEHTLKEWKRIYGYERETMTMGRFVSTNKAIVIQK